MTDHLSELRAYMDIAGTRYTYQDAPAQHQAELVTVEVAPDQDTLLESLELLRFKLSNHRQMTGTDEYALGYEEACLKVVEMIDGIIRNHQVD